VVLCRQLTDWQKSRKRQAGNRSQKPSFGMFVDQVHRRRQVQGLSGNFDLVLDMNRQNQLGNWVEFQDYHLKGLEQLEMKRDNLKQDLNKCGSIRTAALEQHLELTKRKLQSHHVLLQWIEQQRLVMTLEVHEDQDPTPEFRTTSTR
jgi:hypothetical protein